MSKHRSRKHGLHLCNCGVHVPLVYWDAHLKGGKHAERIKRINAGLAPLPTKPRRGKKSGGGCRRTYSFDGGRWG